MGTSNPHTPYEEVCRRPEGRPAAASITGSSHIERDFSFHGARNNVIIASGGALAAGQSPESVRNDAILRSDRKELNQIDIAPGGSK